MMYVVGEKHWLLHERQAFIVKKDGAGKLSLLHILKPVPVSVIPGAVIYLRQ